MFYKCEECDSVLMQIFNSHSEINCCGKLLNPIKPQKPDDLHTIFADFNGDNVTVTIGERNHPMDSEHRILFITVQTRDRILIKKLPNNRRASAKFHGVTGECRIYAFCSVHGLFCDRIKNALN